MANLHYGKAFQYRGFAFLCVKAKRTVGLKMTTMANQAEIINGKFCTNDNYFYVIDPLDDKHE